MGLFTVLGLLGYGLIKNIIGPDPCRCLALQYDNPNVHSELSSRIRSNPNQTYDELKDDIRELQEKQENSWALSKSCSDFYFKKANLTYDDFRPGYGGKRKYIAYLSGLCNNQKGTQYEEVPEVLTDNIYEDEVIPEEIEMEKVESGEVKDVEWLISLGDEVDVGVWFLEENYNEGNIFESETYNIGHKELLDKLKSGKRDSETIDQLKDMLKANGKNYSTSLYVKNYYREDERIYGIDIAKNLDEGINYTPRAQAIVNVFPGSYSFGDPECQNGCGTLLVRPRYHRGLMFYLSINSGAPSWNSGSLKGQFFRTAENTFEYTSNEFGFCSLTFKLDYDFENGTRNDRAVIVKTVDNRNNCGFGHNVSADGVYKLLNDDIPYQYINQEGEVEYMEEELVDIAEYEYVEELEGEVTEEEEVIIEEMPLNEIEEDFEVPFAVVENVPVFPGCESGSNEKQRVCFRERITKFVQRKFNYELGADLGLSGRQRVNVIFKIDKSGNVIDVRARAPHPRLEKEAIRVVNLLPKMQPGKQRGKAVIVPYRLPITFQVQD